jgi:hypothetical protein
VTRTAVLAAAATFAALMALLPSQDERRAKPGPPPPQQPDLHVSEPAWLKTVERDDYRELHVFGGFRVTAAPLGLDVRGENALVLLDLEASHALLDPDSSTPPRRGIAPPDPRRALTNDMLRERLLRSLSAFGSTDTQRIDALDDRMLDAVRYLYAEGGIVVVRDGVEVLRCDRLWVSPLDDRIVVENAELRYVTPGRADATYVARGPKLVKQGGRWTGRDVILTTCSAGDPHYAMAIDDLEIIERDGEFEIRARGQSLQIGGTSVLPLPNATFFTKSQGPFPIRGVRGSYSGKEGVSTEVVLGLPWNDTGGALHHWLTGRPAKEFRGDWELGLGWIEERGAPITGVLDYRVNGLYEGRTEGFWIDERGDDLREITIDFAGNDIPGGNRTILRTQNRVHFGAKTHLDLVAFRGSDPGVWSEYFGSAYRNDETPETSAYLHHANGNRLLTVGMRSNLSEFSYRDDRALAEKFTEESPVVTYQWLAEPLARTPWDTPIVVDLATEIGQRRSDYDDLAPDRIADRTLRADQLVELSAPFSLAGLNVRPYFAGRGTWYDNTVDGDSEGRVAMTGGVQMGTRLSRTWSWLDGEEMKGVRHVMAPKLTYIDRFHVDDDGSEFFQFDDLDSLDEERLFRFELRNLVQTMAKTELGKEPRDFIFLDLAQDLYPDKGRDNGGEVLGLFRYDLLLRPQLRWLPFDNFAYAIYGDHDWEDGLRTFDTELLFGPLAGITWTADYRRDSEVDGAVGVTAYTRLLDRWELYVGSQRDLDRDLWLNYTGGLRRVDHDWTIQVSVAYDNFVDETTLRLDFTPRLGAFSSPRSSRFGPVSGPEQFATAY